MRWRFTKLLVWGGAALLVLAVAIRLYMGSYGNCKTNRDCDLGRTCMKWSFDSLPWWARGMTYRTCEVPCEGDASCPRTHTCVLVDHGPGPGAHCMPRSALPHWNKRGPHEP